MARIRNYGVLLELFKDWKGVSNMKILIFIIIVVFLCGCFEDKNAKSQISNVEPKIATLEHQLTLHDDKIEQMVKDLKNLKIEVGTKSDSSLEPKIATLERQLTIYENKIKQVVDELKNLKIEIGTKLDLESPAVVDPAVKEYSIAKNEYGAFPVSIDDVQPYLDGHKVKFRVGNLTSATLTGIKLKIFYGPRNPLPPSRNNNTDDEKYIKLLNEYFDTVEKNRKKCRELVINSEKKFLPGTWNVVETIIIPSKPEDIGRIEVNVIVEGIVMSVSQ